MDDIILFALANVNHLRDTSKLSFSRGAKHYLVFDVIVLILNYNLHYEIIYVIRSKYNITQLNLYKLY